VRELRNVIERCVLFSTGPSLPIEWLQLVAEKMGWDNLFWQTLESLNFGQLGIGVVVLMLLAWGTAWWYYRRALEDLRRNGEKG